MRLERDRRYGSLSSKRFNHLIGKTSMSNAAENPRQVKMKTDSVQNAGAYRGLNSAGGSMWGKASNWPPSATCR